MPNYDDLSHVPRRAVGMVKDLRRMGLYVVNRAGMFLEGSPDMSSNDVKQVSESAKAIAKLGQDARRIREKLDQSIADVHEALGVADGVADALRSAGAELRGALGVQTNNPPKDDDDNARKKPT